MVFQIGKLKKCVLVRYLVQNLQSILCGGHTQTTIVQCLRSSSAARSMYVLVFHLST
jgi:hypothetical protein